MRNTSDKICRENRNVHSVINNSFLSRKSYHIWDSVESRTGHRWHITAHEICMLDNEGKNRNTQSKYVILTAFPLQQWLHERASMLRYTYIVCHLRIGSHNFVHRDLW